MAKLMTFFVTFELFVSKVINPQMSHYLTLEYTGRMIFLSKSDQNVKMTLKVNVDQKVTEIDSNSHVKAMIWTQNGISGTNGSKVTYRSDGQITRLEYIGRRPKPDHK